MCRFPFFRYGGLELITAISLCFSQAIGIDFDDLCRRIMAENVHPFHHFHKQDLNVLIMLACMA